VGPTDLLIQEIFPLKQDNCVYSVGGALFLSTGPFMYIAHMTQQTGDPGPQLGLLNAQRGAEVFFKAITAKISLMEIR
jgi:hypothetical protein